MTAWQIVLLVLGIINALALIVCICIFIDEWKKEDRLQWGFLLMGIFFYPVLLLYLIVLTYEFVSESKEDGGLIAHYRKERERKRTLKKGETEYKRIEKAYKQGKIRRDQLPKNIWGHLEFYGKLAGGNWRDLIYVENSYNPQLNEFFKSHPDIPLKHGMRVLYLPEYVKRLTSQEFIEYNYPGAEQPQRELEGIDSTYLVQDLCYPDDVAELRHGFVVFFGWSFNHGAEYLNGKYYHLEEGTDDEILAQIEAIAKTVYEAEAGGLFCQLPPAGEEGAEDFADRQFNMEVNKLIDEVRERIRRLEQRGISRKLLQRIFEEDPKLSRLVVTKDYRIVLPDYHDKEIKMEPLVKAVYLLFLKYPEGILFKCLPDYREELTQIYVKMKPYGLNDRVRKSIEDVTNPLLNSINEKCARIKGAFVGQFDDSLASHYYIDGFRGGKKKIKLSRDLVIWE